MPRNSNDSSNQNDDTTNNVATNELRHRTGTFEIKPVDPVLLLSDKDAAQEGLDILKKYQPLTSSSDTLIRVGTLVFSLMYIAMLSYRYVQDNDSNDKKISTEEEINKLQGRYKALENQFYKDGILIKDYRRDAYGNKYLYDTSRKTCSEIEYEKILACNKKVASSTCADIQQQYCNLPDLIKISMLAGKFMDMDSKFIQSMTPAILLACFTLWTLIKSYQLENKHAQLSSSGLSLDEIIKIQTIGSKLNIEIPGTANVRQISAAFKQRLDVANMSPEFGQRPYGVFAYFNQKKTELPTNASRPLRKPIILKK